MNAKHYKKILVFAFIALLVVLIPVKITRAQVPISTIGAGLSAAAPSAQNNGSVNSYSCSILSLPTCIAFFISYLVTYFAGFFVAFAIWLVQLGLLFNQNIFNSPLVQTGFGISLSIANLGFVLGIIVIAIATILRRESYGMKQLLWKLVFMAVVINFGFAITAPAVGFANSLSTTFETAMSGGKTIAADGVSGVAQGFSDTLTGAFSVNNLLQGPNSNDAAAGAASTSFLKSIMSLVFNAIFSFVIVIALFALAALLLIRYCYLGALLILLPFAWLSWVFPKYSGNFDKWLGDFVKWTFFPPLVLFFIYLALITAGQSTGNTTSQTSAAAAAYQQSIGISSTQINTGSTNQQDPSSALANLINNGDAASGQRSVVAVVADDILLLSLLVMGLFAASALTGKAGAGVVNVAKSVGGAVGGYVGKRTKNAAQKAARTTYRAADRGVARIDKALGRFGGGGVGITQGLQQSRFTDLATAGRGLAAIETNHTLVAEAAKSVPADKETFTRNMAGGMSNELRMAYFQKGAEKGWLKAGTVVGGKDVTTYLQKNKDVFKAYGQDGEGSVEEKARDQSGLTLADGSKKLQELKTKNTEIDKKRNLDLNLDEAQEKAGLSDEEMEFYTGKKDDEIDTLSDGDKKKYYGIKKKVQDAEAKTGLSDDDQKEYEKNQDEMDKIKAKIKRSDPELLAGLFVNGDKARKQLTDQGKEVPVTLEQESLDRVQKVILETFTEGFSPQNARGLIEAIAKGNNFKSFESAVNNLKANDKDGFGAIQESLNQNINLKTWMQKNEKSASGALYGNLRELFGLKKLVKKRKEKDGTTTVVEENEVEEEDELPKAA